MLGVASSYLPRLSFFLPSSSVFYTSTSTSTSTSTHATATTTWIAVCRRDLPRLNTILNPPPSLMVILQFTMDSPPQTPPQPITSKLAIVAARMDDFLRQDNARFSHANAMLGVHYRLLLDELLQAQQALRLRDARIRELEFDLRSALDHNERLVEFNYVLEVSILDCDHHQHIPHNSVARRLSFESETIDLTSDEELVLDADDVEL